MQHISRAHRILMITMTASALTFGQARAQVVESVTVAKSVTYVQTSANSVIMDPTPPTANYGGPYGFSASISGQNLSGIAPPTVSGPIVLGLPGGPSAFSNNNGKLVYNAHDGSWEYGFPKGDNWGATSQAIIDSAFRNGTYTFAGNGIRIPLSLTGDAYPNTPILTLNGGIWSGGKYVLDASHALVITTNAFVGYGTHGDDRIAVGLSNGATRIQFHDITPGTDMVSLTIPAFSLTPGQDYLGGAIFSAIVDDVFVPALPSSFNSARYEVSTSFDLRVVSAVPEPGAFALLMGSGIGGWLFLRRRSRLHP